MSTVAHGKITSIDESEALQCQGVKDYISVNDVPASNNYGVVINDEVVFAHDKVGWCYVIYILVSDLGCAFVK